MRGTRRVKPPSLNMCKCLSSSLGWALGIDINNSKLGSHQHRNVIRRGALHNLRNRQILFRVVDPMDHAVYSRRQAGLCICHSRPGRCHLCAARRLPLFSHRPRHGRLVDVSGFLCSSGDDLPKANTNRLTAISLAIYAIIAYRRLSKYDEYSSPVDAKTYLFNDDIETSYSNVSYSSRPGDRGSVGKRESLGSSRLSVGSVTNPTILEPVEQRPRRYSHERDTQFDEYVSRRASGGYKPTSAPSSPPIVVTLDDSLVSLGTVHSRSRGSSVSQLTTSDHVLVSVPEEEGEASPSNRKPSQQVGLAR